MKEIWIFFTYMILIILVGGAHILGKFNDLQASLIFIGIFVIPFGLKLLFLPRKKQD